LTIVNDTCSVLVIKKQALGGSGIDNTLSVGYESDVAPGMESPLEPPEG
jgi:hypothetical protein